MSLKVPISGASRGIGLATLKACLADGHEVRALARTAFDIPIEDQALEKFLGDALAAADVEQAPDCIDAAVQVLGVPMNFKVLTGPMALYSLGYACFGASDGHSMGSKAHYGNRFWGGRRSA